MLTLLARLHLQLPGQDSHEEAIDDAVLIELNMTVSTRYLAEIIELTSIFVTLVRQLYVDADCACRRDRSMHCHDWATAEQLATFACKQDK